MKSVSTSILALIAGSASAFAQTPTYTAQGIRGACSSQSPSAAASACGLLYEGSTVTSGSAAASPTFLSADISRGWWADWCCGEGYVGGGDAEIKAWVTFSGPPGTVACTPTLQYNATCTANHPPFLPSRWVDMRWSFSVLVNGNPGTHYFQYLDNYDHTGPTGFRTLTDSLNPGIDSTGPRTIVLHGEWSGPTTTYQVGVPSLLTFKITNNAEIGGGGSMWITSNLSIRAWLPAIGPVFNLPAGYSADSPDLNIVNNHFNGPAPFPVITSQTGDLNGCVGQSAILTVAASGTGTSTFQWRKGNTALSNDAHYSGVTTPTLTISGISTVEAGSYNCVVTNAFGAATSEPAAMAVCAADFDCDLQVDDADFVRFADAYNILDCADPDMPASCPSDMNRDGLVDDTDFVTFVEAYDALLCS